MSNTCNGTTRQGRPCTRPVAAAGENCGQCKPFDVAGADDRAGMVDDVSALSDLHTEFDEAVAALHTTNPRTGSLGAAQDRLSEVSDRILDESRRLRPGIDEAVVEARGVVGRHMADELRASAQGMRLWVTETDNLPAAEGARRLMPGRFPVPSYAQARREVLSAADERDVQADGYESGRVSPPSREWRQELHPDDAELLEAVPEPLHSRFGEGSAG